MDPLYLEVPQGKARVLAIQAAISTDSFEIGYSFHIGCSIESGNYQDIPGCGETSLSPTNSPLLLTKPGRYRILPGPTNSEDVFVEVGPPFDIRSRTILGEVACGADAPLEDPLTPPGL